MTADVAAELRALAEFLSPELAFEVYRLQEVELARTAELEELTEVRRQLLRAETASGVYHERATKAERKLEDLGVEEISKARRSAFMVGDGFVRITSRGRGSYTTVHVPSDQVVLRR